MLRVRPARTLAAMLFSIPKLPTLLAVTAALCVVPAAAQATTVSYDGTVVTATGTDGADGVDYSVYEGRLLLNGSPMIAGPGCTDDAGSQVEVSCPVPAGGLVVKLLGGDDRVSGYASDAAPGWVKVDLGAGNDFLETYGADTVDGGPGADEIKGIAKTGDNTFDGGDGNDTIRGGGGNDVVRGGAGDDTLIGDPMEVRGADVLDGGPGKDTVDDYMHDDAYNKDPATVTLDGVADDGIEGEHDNVTNVEVVQSAAGVVFRGTDAAETVIATQVGGKGSQYGMGGDDSLQGSDDDETIDGGAGNDDIRAGYGNDTITGGPGRDKIVADRDGRCNEMACDLSPGSASDTIDAVDGEQDTISCGPGADTVKADPIDTVASDCETVTRTGGTATPGGGGQPGTQQPAAPSGSTATAKLTVSGARSLKALTAGRLRVQIAGLRPGASAKVRALRGRTVVATGTGRADTRGVAKVTIRLTKAGKRALKRAKTAKLTLVAGDQRLVVSLKR
jgi:Ca2+-binding RTX toxin-like protein